MADGADLRRTHLSRGGCHAPVKSRPAVLGWRRATRLKPVRPHKVDRRNERQPAAVREPNQRVGRHRSPDIRFSLRRGAVAAQRPAGPRRVPVAQCDHTESRCRAGRKRCSAYAREQANTARHLASTRALALRGGAAFLVAQAPSLTARRGSLCPDCGSGMRPHKAGAAATGLSGRKQDGMTGRPRLFRVCGES
jgi:hypothetical protein